MKKTLSLFSGLLLLAMSAFAGETNKTITLAWDHDGLNTGLYRVFSRQASNDAFLPIMTVPATNRTATIVITNPPPRIEFAVSAMNAYGDSELSEPVRLSEPSTPNALRVISIITVQIP